MKHFSQPYDHHECEGKYIRQICNLSMLDMKEIYARNTMENGKQKCFIANKFNMKIDARAIICTARKLHFKEFLIAKKQLLML